MIEMEYRKELSKLYGSIWRPVAEVLLEGPRCSFSDLFYVDSGADIKLIPDEMGRLLGLERPQEGKQELAGVGGHTIGVHVVILPMSIGGHRCHAQVAWAFNDDVPLLLGRTDIFDTFRVGFDQQALVTRFDSYQ